MLARLRVVEHAESSVMNRSTRLRPKVSWVLWGTSTIYEKEEYDLGDHFAERIKQAHNCCAQQTGIGHVIVEALLTISTYVRNDLLMDDEEIRSTDRFTYSVHFSWSCLK